MAHLAHYKRAGAAPMLAHYERRAELERGYSRENIDASRTAGNYAIGADSPQALAAALRSRVAEAIAAHEADSGKAVRKDANVISDWVVTLPKDCPRQDARKFFEVAVDFCRERYGADCVLGGFVHMDEATPHAHIPVVPVKGGRLRSAKVFTRSDLQRFHKRTWARPRTPPWGATCRWSSTPPSRARSSSRTWGRRSTWRPARRPPGLLRGRLRPRVPRGPQRPDWSAFNGASRMPSPWRRRAWERFGESQGRANTLEAENRQLEREIESLESELRPLEERATRLEAEVTPWRQRRQALQRRSRTLSEACDGLRESTESLRDECERLGESAASLEDECESLSDELSSCEDYSTAHQEGAKAE